MKQTKIKNHICYSQRDLRRSTFLPEISMNKYLILIIVLRQKSRVQPFAADNSLYVIQDGRHR